MSDKLTPERKCKGCSNSGDLTIFDDDVTEYCITCEYDRTPLIDSLTAENATLVEALKWYRDDCVTCGGTNEVEYTQSGKDRCPHCRAARTALEQR